MLNGKPCTTYQRLQARLRAEHGIQVSIGSIFNAMHELGISRKRVVTRKIYGTLARIEEERESFRRVFDTDVYRTAISIDETHFYSHPCPRYGYSRKGKRILRHSRNSGTNYSCLAAMDCHGLLGYAVQEGSVNGERFSEFLRRLGVRERSLILDNARIHHCHLAQDAMNELGCKANFIPPYTPEYNPIELMFSQVKAADFRSVYTDGNQPRNAIDAAFSQVSPENCRNYFAFVRGRLWGTITDLG